MFSVEDVADRLGVSISLVYELVARREITCYRIGRGRGTIRFAEADVEAYLERRRCPVSGESASAAASKPRKRSTAQGWF